MSKGLIRSHTSFLTGRFNKQTNEDNGNEILKTAFVVGNGLRGKLGLGYQRHIREVLKHEEMPDNMIRLCCGEHHAVSLTSSLNVCTWGSNKEGQLGYDTSGSNEDVTFFDVMKDGKSEQPIQMAKSPKKPKPDPLLCELSAVVPSLIAKSVTNIAASNSSTFALTSDGFLYSWGSNEEGELALGDVQNTKIPSLVQFFEGTPIKDIIAGGHHVLAVVENGDLYSWGRNKEGQLCLTDLFSIKEKFSVPQEVITIQSICRGISLKKIVAGNNHSIALLSDGSVLVWGENTHGQLGLADNVNRHEAAQLKFEGQSIIDVNASHSASYVLTQSGFVYVFGKCDRGQLGIGKPDPEFLPHFKNQNRPTLLRVQPGVSRLFTSAMSDHVFLLTKDKRVFVFGDNEDKECCVKDEDIVWSPKELTNLKREDKRLLNIVTGQHCTFLFYD
ncbi:ultraviolet-B receptor UVR8 [Acrasis kona]|uniref:Ultraviolet-B receptor UVR8 n=1 Tax=Acrasis kona TaxID=1008807 RepID=A0AAW2ZJ46_9EUKA